MSKNFLNKIQKIVCFSFVIASCLVMIGSLCFFSSGWDVFQVSGNNNVENFLTTFLGNQSTVISDVSAARAYYISFYDKIQSTNNVLFYTAFASLIMIAIAGVTGVFTRKKYYISNLVTGIAASIVPVVMSIVTIVKSISLKSDFAYISPDFARYQELWGTTGMYHEISSTNCLIGIILPIIMIIVALIFGAFVILKYLATNKTAVNEEALSNE